MRYDLKKFYFCALLIRPCPYLRACRLRSYQLAIWRMASSQWMVPKLYNASVGIVLHSTLFGICFPSCRSVSWQRRILSALKIALKGLFAAQIEQRSSTAVSSFCSARQMQLLVHSSSSRCSRLHPRFLRRVLFSYFASFN